MNSYNENLQSSVMASLLSLQLAQKSMKSKLDASIFSLYYAEGARINAGEKLDAATVTYKAQQKIRAHAVTNNNIAVNLLTSANQQKKYTARSVTNTAVSASNVQIASNAVVRLAGDVGSIYSILKAADFDSEIYLQAQEAYDLMSDTAYDAEQVSQMAMEASTLTAEVSSSTVTDEAKSTNESIVNLFTIASTDFDTISATVADYNTALADASAAEKKAEGVLEFINVEYFATKSAYTLNNTELNLNLSVPKEQRTNDSYVVTFNYYKSPFAEKEARVQRNRKDKPNPVPLNDGYPVKDYYILLVKDSKKTVFTISNAEGLLKNNKQYVKVPSFTPVPPTAPQNASAQPGGKPARHHNAPRGTKQKIYISELTDSDGDRMQLGQKYVVFVLAKLTSEYKQGINNYDDYLSAPSATFKLTNKLSGPDAGNIHVSGQALEFTYVENSKNDVEYRCMFLPDNKGLIKGLLSEDGLRTVEEDVRKLETISDKYDPIIAKLESEINTMISTLDELGDRITELEEQDQSETDPEKKQKITDEINRLKNQQTETATELSKTKAQYLKNKKEKDKEIKTINPAKDTQPGFFFNLKLAEQVPAANFIIAQTKITEEANDKLVTYTVNGTAKIDESTTDNFGDPLIKGKKYVPIVLTTSTAPEEDLDQFANYLSPYKTTESFVYDPQS